MSERPIANKYREGKMKRTLKRELKVLEIVKRETLGTSSLSLAVESTVLGSFTFSLLQSPPGPVAGRSRLSVRCTSVVRGSASVGTRGKIPVVR